MPAFNLATDIYGLILTYFMHRCFYRCLFILDKQAITIFLTFWLAIFLFLFQFDICIFIHYFIYRLFIFIQFLNNKKKLI